MQKQAMVKTLRNCILSQVKATVSKKQAEKLYISLATNKVKQYKNKI